MNVLEQAIQKREDYDGDNNWDVVLSITGIFMYTEDEDYEFKIREIIESCVRELKNDATTRHAKSKRNGLQTRLLKNCESPAPAETRDWRPYARFGSLLTLTLRKAGSFPEGDADAYRDELQLTADWLKAP